MKSVKRLLAAVILIVAMVSMSVMNAGAYTVAGVGKRGFGDFSKAIVFTGNSCPVNAETIVGSTAVRNCALPMKPVGDGSWVCTATMFPGTGYTYYFEYRIPKFEDTANWKGSAATGNRVHDPSKDIVAPVAATNGYVLYHIFGDQTVMGTQGMDKQGGDWDTELTVQNVHVAEYRGTTRVSSTGDGDTSNMDGSNSFGITVVQLADTRVRIDWTLNGAAGDGFVPTVEGAREFDTISTGGPTTYGFKILRARMQSAGSTSPIQQYLKFEDTVVYQVTGDSFYSPHRDSMGIGWYSQAHNFIDTSLPSNTAVGDSYIYTVLWTDAYGLSNDTADQNFLGGNRLFTRGAQVDFIFLVEKFDPGVVFPDGRTEGTLYLTPYVNGIPNPYKKVKTRAFMVSPKAAG